MHTSIHKFIVEDKQSFRNRMLNWANRFNIFCFLDHNDYEHSNASFDCLLAADSTNEIRLSNNNSLSELRAFQAINKEWLFGHLNYPSAQNDPMGFPPGFFFTPAHLISLKGNEVTLQTSSADPFTVLSEIEQTSNQLHRGSDASIQIEQLISQQAYLQALEKIKNHIQRGDCYEINFCQPFLATDVYVNPLWLFQRLNEVSPNPFAACYKWNNSYCLCASPERFLAKKGNRLISQPIKGTAKRDLNDWNEDSIIKDELRQSEKNKSENVMIVDLVRNDLSRICERGSVGVDELFGVYSFPQLHHMISTISGKVNSEKHWTEILEACFPMGSMTGAPKKRVMELIDTYEMNPRGLFSGTIGYIDPNGDFDFNVVIRSIFMNTALCSLSFMAGGGITINSDPQLEYEESLAKAAAIKLVLSSTAII